LTLHSFGKDSGRRCPHRHGKGFGTATRTSPPRRMRGHGQDVPNWRSIPIPSRFPIGDLRAGPIRSGTTGARSAALGFRVGIGIGIAIGIENEEEHASSNSIPMPIPIPSGRRCPHRLEESFGTETWTLPSWIAGWLKCIMYRRDPIAPPSPSRNAIKARFQHLGSLHFLLPSHRFMENLHIRHSIHIGAPEDRHLHRGEHAAQLSEQFHTRACCHQIRRTVSAGLR
jgi:hypothetical protein